MQEQKKKKIRSRDITHRMIVMNQMHRRMLECNLEGTGIHRAQHRLLMTLAKHSFASQVELAKFSESEKEQLCDYFDRIYENMERLKNAAMEGQNETV